MTNDPCETPDLPSIPDPFEQRQQDPETNPYSTWPNGEVFNDLARVVELSLARFNVPKNTVITILGKGLNITTKEKVESTLVNIANHDLIDKYRKD